jgi:hypothetical protein
MEISQASRHVGDGLRLFNLPAPGWRDLGEERRVAIVVAFLGECSSLPGCDQFFDLASEEIAESPEPLAVSGPTPCFLGSEGDMGRERGIDQALTIK